MFLLYGIEEAYIDITSILLSYKSLDNAVIIPQSDEERAALFSDPLPGILKHIKIIDDYGNSQILDIGFSIKLYLKNDKLDIRSNEHKIINVENRLSEIHNPLVFSFGSLLEELPEQHMTVQYLDPEDKVLELGGNIGRNSCIIAKLLNDQNNLLVIEPNREYYMQLMHNRNQNLLTFHVENSALSLRKLVQDGWVTYDDQKKQGHNVSTITYKDLIAKYNINFDTLVCDCEDCLYNILSDMPDMISNFKKIIWENDSLLYPAGHEHSNYIMDILKNNSFKLVYKKSLLSYPDFYQVWIR